MLYIVALPIGNVDDISLRAIEVLKTVDLILCEDTRQFKKYQVRFDIKTNIRSYEDFKEREQSEYVGNLMKKKGMKVALVSDAGTPMISDPGYHLLKECYLHNIAVTSIPGPSAVTAAVSTCVFNDGVFQFSGFYEQKKHKELILSADRDLVFFESPKRIKQTLVDLTAILADRRIFVAKEMTKEYEKFYLFAEGYDINNNLTISDIVELGEFVFIIEKPTKCNVFVNYEELWKEFQHLHIKDISKITSHFTGLSSKVIYENLVKIKERERNNNEQEAH